MTESINLAPGSKDWKLWRKLATKEAHEALYKCIRTDCNLGSHRSTS